MRKTAAVAAVLIAVTSPACAWWDYAKWGMTLDDLRKASGGKIEECNTSCRLGTTHVIRNVQVVGFSGEVGFAFTPSGQLDRTVLWFEDPLMESALEAALLGVYGAPVGRATGAIKTTTWRGEDRTTIALTVLTQLKGTSLSGVFVIYRPVAKGL